LTAIWKYIMSLLSTKEREMSKSYNEMVANWHEAVDNGKTPVITVDVDDETFKDMMDTDFTIIDDEITLEEWLDK